MIDVEAIFKRLEGTDEYMKFERVEPKPSYIPDLCAFLMLESLDLIPKIEHGPNAGRHWSIVANAEHDEIFLQVDMDKLAETATEEFIIDLYRCGVMYDQEGLKMFV